jgi:hypothetical protein
MHRRAATEHTGAPPSGREQGEGTGGDAPYPQAPLGKGGGRGRCSQDGQTPNGPPHGPRLCTLRPPRAPLLPRSRQQRTPPTGGHVVGGRGEPMGADRHGPPGPVNTLVCLSRLHPQAAGPAHPYCTIAAGVHVRWATSAAASRRRRTPSACAAVLRQPHPAAVRQRRGRGRAWRQGCADQLCHARRTRARRRALWACCRRCPSHNHACQCRRSRRTRSAAAAARACIARTHATCHWCQAIRCRRRATTTRCTCTRRACRPV